MFTEIIRKTTSVIWSQHACLCISWLCYLSRAHICWFCWRWFNCWRYEEGVASGSFPINICTVGYRRDWRNSVARHGRSRERTLVKKEQLCPAGLIYVLCLRPTVLWNKMVPNTQICIWEERYGDLFPYDTVNNLLNNFLGFLCLYDHVSWHTLVWRCVWR